MIDGSTVQGVGRVLRKWAGPALAVPLVTAFAVPAAAPPEEGTTPEADALRPEPVTVRWEPAPVVQGTVFQVIVSPGGEPLSEVRGTLVDQPLHFREDGQGQHVALAAVPIDASGEVELRVEVRSGAAGPGGGEVSVHTHPVIVVAGEYRMQRLTVAPEFGRPQPPEIQERIRSESARAMAVARRSHDTPRMWEAPFVAPRESRITSGFGHGRVFNDQVQSRHMGTDFAGAEGAPILAPARGIVALADAFYLGGNVVYLDHGAGLVTGYLHLSAREVEEGDLVEPGQVIGRIGATGRVTGPHLHWIVRYGGITVDGMSLLQIH